MSLQMRAVSDRSGCVHCFSQMKDVIRVQGLSISFHGMEKVQSKQR